MTNAEVLKQYGTEKWVVKETLCYMLQEYWEKCGNAGEMTINPVAFIESFMQEETLCSLKYAELSKMSTVETNVVDTIDAEDIVEL